MAARPAPVPARFEGFADRDARFFRALAKHQSRDWFNMHRGEYERGWQIPMRLLLAELREKLDPLFERHALGESKVFRIHRDVRFSKDKSPYKTHIGGYVPLHGGRTGPSQPVAVYVHVGTDTFVGAGHYMMDPDQVARYRAAVLDDAQGRALVRILAATRKAGVEVRAYDALKKVPRGVDPAHPRADLLAWKSVTAIFPTVPKPMLASRQLVGWLVRQTRKVVPLVEWLGDVTG
jgi:uncharacterized protein (TIGR02453 family)